MMPGYVINRSWMIVIVAGLAAGASACADEPVSGSLPIRPVHTERVVAAGDARTRTFSGVAQSQVESRLSFRVPGAIVALPVSVGDEVQPGTVLAELDRTDYDLKLDEARAALARAQAQQRNAEAEYGRVRALYENNNASKAQLDAARAAAESSMANTEASERQLDLAQRQIEYATLEAPATGAVSVVQAEINENVQPGQVVVVLVSRSDLEVTVTVPEGLISEIRQGQAVTVAFDAFPGRTLGGVVTEVGVSPTQTGGTFPVTVRLHEAPAALRAGMTADVTFAFDAAGTGVIYVSPPAVGDDRSGRYVFVVEPSSTAGLGVVHRRAVSVGDLTGNGFEVTTGLTGGELVVTAGVPFLEDGQQVRLTDQER